MIFLPLSIKSEPLESHDFNYRPSLIPDRNDWTGNGRFYTRERIIRLEEFGQTFVVRLVMRFKYKDGLKTHYVSRRTFLRNTSWRRITKGSADTASADNYFLKYSDQEWFQTGADYLEPPSPI